MASAGSLQAIGNWSKDVGVGLDTALAVSMDICGKSGEKACRQALGFMTASAAKITKVAPKNRKVHGTGRNRYIENWRQGRSYAQALTYWMFKDKEREMGTWEDARKIGHRGLAKRSWMWGMSKLGMKRTGSPIPGASRVSTIRSETVNGYIKEDKLGYIVKAMPRGWERMVEMAAGKRIMGMARNKLEGKWRRTMNLPKLPRGKHYLSNRQVADYFLKNVA